MIIGYAQMMQELPQENTPENLQVILDEAQRLAELTGDLLDLGKLQRVVNSYSLLPLFNKFVGRSGKTLPENAGRQRFIF